VAMAVAEHTLAPEAGQDAQRFPMLKLCIMEAGMAQLGIVVQVAETMGLLHLANILTFAGAI